MKCSFFSEGSGPIMIITICSVASVISLGVLLFALYMLCTNMRGERKAKTHQQDVVGTMKDIRLIIIQYLSLYFVQIKSVCTFQSKGKGSLLLVPSACYSIHPVFAEV